ncbi:MAG: hypothetical protein N3A68_09150, partial [Bacteroidia bacterium]|nr:hypothetical protein [Bacteroidia bacterium]
MQRRVFGWLAQAATLTGFTLLHAQDPCGEGRIWYVAPGGCTGGANCGSRSNPADIYWARNQACAVATPTAPHVIRLAVGNYTLDNTIELCSNVYWEGGYDQSQQWKKTNASNTILNRTTANAETVWPPRLIGIRGVGVTNFQIHDIVLNVQGYAPGVRPTNHGMSVYGIYLAGCSNYRIVRCEVNPGRGADGANGPNGANGGGGGWGCNGANG